MHIDWLVACLSVQPGSAAFFISKVKIADFNCAEECPGPNFEIFDAQGCDRGVSLGKIHGF
jgi:hypothetical protein